MVRLARENSGWGYDRIVGALANLGYQVSDQTGGNILRRHCLGPVSERSKTDDLEGLHSPAHGRSCRHGFLHGRCANLARTGDVRGKIHESNLSMKALKRRFIVSALGMTTLCWAADLSLPIARTKTKLAVVPVLVESSSKSGGQATFRSDTDG